MKNPMIVCLFACHFRQNDEFRRAPITVQIGRLLARAQNAALRLQNKAFRKMLPAACAFFRFQHWEEAGKWRSSPEGTAEGSHAVSAVPSGLNLSITQPNVETLGYCRMSLRDRGFS